jgi:hypothetical protein
MSLVEYTERELRRVGLFDPDSDYGGRLGEGVLKLMRTFAEDGHSSGSAMMTLHLFNRLARFEPLTPITDSSDEWFDVSECNGRPLWQSMRSPVLFSSDGGKTYYHVDDPERKIQASEPAKGA